jgi:predicted O-methyltransferase YrrM
MSTPETHASNWGPLTVEQAHQAEFAVSHPNTTTPMLVRWVGARCVAEVGVYQGATSTLLAEAVGTSGELHLFDFEDRVEEVRCALQAAGHRNVVAHPNSRRAMDSYNWSLMKLLRDQPEPLFDYVFLDGAHTWPIDALAFCLLDRLLKPGGLIDFDDYDWTLARSPTMRPSVRPVTAELYTDEQMESAHVRLIVDLLVRRDPRYEEVVEDKVFRKRDA